MAEPPKEGLNAPARFRTNTSKFGGRRAEGIYGQSTSRAIPNQMVADVASGRAVFGGGKAGAPPPSPYEPYVPPLAATGPAMGPAGQPIGGPNDSASNGPASQSTALITLPPMGMQPAGSSAAPPPAPTGPVPPVSVATYFGPGVPQIAMAPRNEVAGRAFDYPSSYNIGNQPRAYEQWSFGMLRALAENYDLIRLLIETRKDQMETLTGSYLPKQTKGQATRPPADDRCAELDAFMECPDGQLPYNTWKRQLFEDLFVIDAPAVYIRRDLMGKPCALEVIDGSTLQPRIDVTGRPMRPPYPAYTQYLKGSPAINYRADELIYMPRNLRPGHLFGQSPVQQIIATVTLGLRREAAKIAYYTSGNIPEALVATPADWKPEDIKQFQASFDARMSDPRRKFGKLTFVPAGVGGPVFTRSEAGLFGEFDEWLARICCYAFSLPELPFVKAQNRATAQVADQAALDQGLAPVMVWWKAFKDRVPKLFGWFDIEFVYNDKEDIEPAELIETHLPAVDAGLFSLDGLLGKMGEPPIGMRHFVKGVGPLGFMFCDDMIKASEMGLTIQAAAPPAPGALPGAVPGQPGAPPAAAPLLTGPASAAPPAAESPPPVRAPALEHQMLTLPPELLAAIGLGPQHEAGRTVDVTPADEFHRDPLSRAVGHPQVLKTLRAAERAAPPKRGASGRPGAARGGGRSSSQGARA